MNLTIATTTSVADIQQAFHHYFPYLKIEVYSKSHELHELNPTTQHLTGEVLLSAISTLKGEGTYDFSAAISTGEFEQGLWSYFGLPIQVMRKSGAIWLQTSQTDDWSLEKQNKEGEIASQPTAPNSAEDYTLRDIE